jgi:aspartyl-tRNA(Asn)/glutamyl-tRNA(Gln) amidotransferase subunit A
MGSVRIPAAYCGVFGHMPAQGRLSTVGVVPLSSTLDRVGVLTRTEEDARALTVAMSSSRPATGRPGPMRLAAVDLSGQVDVDPSVHEAFKATVARARDAGLSVTTISLDGYDAVRLPRACLFIAEVEALSEYGSALDGDAAGLSPQLHGMLSWARRQPPAKRAEAYRTLRLCADALNEQLSGFDALLTPTTNSPAFAFEQPAPQDQAAFALLGNILGWAATAFPVGVDSTGLPLSAQIMCRNDADALSGAGKLARAGGPPPCFSMNAED